MKSSASTAVGALNAADQRPMVSYYKCTIGNICPTGSLGSIPTSYASRSVRVVMLRRTASSRRNLVGHMRAGMTWVHLWAHANVVAKQSGIRF